MGATAQQIQDIAMLKAGRNPSWQNFGPAYYATKPPGEAADLYSLALPDGGYAMRAYIDLVLRRNPNYRTALVTVTVYDDTTDYTVTIDGEAHTQNGTTDGPTTLGLLRDDINDGITFSGLRTIKGRSSYQVATYDAATTYTVIVDGRSHAVVAQGSIAATVTALIASITAHHSAKIQAIANTTEIPGVTAGEALVLNNLSGESYEFNSSVAGGAGTKTSRDHPTSASVSGGTLTIVGTGREDYTIEVSAATGTGYLALDADATSVELEVWGLGVNRTIPSKPDGAAPVAYTENTLIQADCAGLSHLQARIVSADGRVAWAVGVANMET